MFNGNGFGNGGQTPWENDFVFLLLLWVDANLSPLPPPPPPSSSHRKDSWNCSFTERKKLKARTFFFSVRFVKIIPIMILLATERMWLLKMDLWKNSYPQKNIGRWMNPTPNPPHPPIPPSHYPNSTELIPSVNSIQEATFVFSRPTSLKVIIPDHKYHFTFPSRLLSWNFEIAEAELIWWGINLPQHLQSLEPALSWTMEIGGNPTTAGYQR